MAETTVAMTTPNGTGIRAYQQTGASGTVLWDNVRDGAATSSSSTIQAGWKEGTNWDATMWRGYISFDTSVLNGGAVFSAKIKLSGRQYWSNYHETTQIGSASSASYADLKTTTDYGALPAQGTGVGQDSVAFLDVEVTLNAAGIANIDPSGTTLVSVRGTGDTTDRGTTAADSWSYVTISSASLIIQHQPVIIFSESISAGESLEKEQNKIMTESIIVGDDIRVDGLLPGRTFSESVTMSEVFGQTFTQELFESIIGKDTIRKILNGTIVSKWVKAAKAISSWTDTAKPLSRWRRKPKK